MFCTFIIPLAPLSVHGAKKPLCRFWTPAPFVKTRNRIRPMFVIKILIH